MDIVIPLVFPDYLIHVDTPEVSVDVPDLIPWFDVMPKRVGIPKTTQKIPQLGHAGVLFIEGKTGMTKYYEYGRYDRAAKGRVEKRLVSDVSLRNGKPTHESLKKVLAMLSLAYGQGGAVSAAYIELPDGSFKKMLDYAQKRERRNADPNRTPYALLTNSCLHFMKEVAQAGGASLPPEVIPTPKLYMAEIRLIHPSLDYSRGVLSVPSLEGAAPRKAAGSR